MTKPNVEQEAVRELVDLARMRAFEAERIGKAITATNFHELARKLEALAPALSRKIEEARLSEAHLRPCECVTQHVLCARCQRIAELERKLS